MELKEEECCRCFKAQSDLGEGAQLVICDTCSDTVCTSCADFTAQNTVHCKVHELV